MQAWRFAQHNVRYQTKQGGMTGELPVRKGSFVHRLLGSGADPRVNAPALISGSAVELFSPFLLFEVQCDVGLPRANGAD